MLDPESETRDPVIQDKHLGSATLLKREFHIRYIFSLFSGQVQLPSWQKERITAPARIPVKHEVIFEIKREVSEPTAEVGKTVEDSVKQRVKKHAIRMVVLRSVVLQLVFVGFRTSA